MLRICPSLNLSDAAATINDGHARCANTVPIGFEPSHVPCMIWETRFLADRAILFSCIPNTAVPNATITSMQTWTIWHYPKVIIRIEWSQWRCGLSLKTGYRIGLHHGIYGETIGFLFPGLQFKTGLKQRGKKAE